MAANRDEVNRIVDYHGDVTELEPALARLYDEALPQIDRELGR